MRVYVYVVCVYLSGEQDVFDPFVIRPIPMENGRTTRTTTVISLASVPKGSEIILLFQGDLVHLSSVYDLYVYVII